MTPRGAIDARRTRPSGGTRRLSAAATLAATLIAGCCQGASPFEPLAREAAATAGLLAAGGAHTCAVLPEGEIACWGDARSGQLGIHPGCVRPGVGEATCYGEDRREKIAPRSEPRRTPMTVLAVSDAFAVAAGDDTTLSLHRDGTIRCWGRARPGPFQAVTGAAGISAISASRRAACAQYGDGRAKCWRTNQHALTPWVSLERRAIGVAAGEGRHCAVHADGTVGCWDHDLVFEARVSPTLVSGVEGAYQVTAGREHFCALARGAAACWGRNDRGQLGDGTTQSRQTAAAVMPLDGARQIAAGAAHTCAVHGDGLVSCWGANESGQLGTGESADAASPVRVSGVAGAVAVAAGGAHSCALLADGRVLCWGSNERGQLGAGDGAELERSLVPVTVCASGRWEEGRCVGGAPLRAGRTPSP